MASDHVFTSVEEFDFLDRLPFESRYMVGDLKKGQRKWYWASQKVCKDLNVPKNFFLNMDMDSGQSQAMEAFHEEIYSKVQCSGEAFSKIKTLHVAGQPLQWLQTYKPLRAKLEGWEEERTIFMSELRDMEESQARDEKQMEQWALGCELLQHSEGMTMMFDAATNDLQYADQKTASFYLRALVACGSDRKELQALADVFACVAWEDAAEQESIVRRVRSLKVGHEPVEVEAMLAQDGVEDADQIWHQYTFTPAFHPVSSKPSIVVTQRDITKLHQQSLQLIQASRDQEAARQRERMFSAVSHELRTPLNGIIGLSEALFCDDDLPLAAIETLKIIHSSGRRLSNLVNDILDAASLKHNGLHLRIDSVSLSQVSKAVVSITAPLCKAGVVLKDSVPSTLPSILGDFDRLVQVLTNLVGNAVKFTEEGVVEVSAFASSEEIVLEVRDTGIGIPANKQEDIFMPFEQVDMSSTRHYEGTGLGLTIVKSLVEAHGGSIALQSSVDDKDHGTTFSVILPIGKPSSVPTSPSGAVASLVGQVSMVVKEDEPASCKQVCEAKPPDDPLPVTPAPSLPPSQPCGGEEAAGDGEEQHRASAAVDVTAAPAASAAEHSCKDAAQAPGTRRCEVLAIGKDKAAWSRHVATLEERGCAVSCCEDEQDPKRLAQAIRDRAVPLDVVLIEDDEERDSGVKSCIAIRESFSMLALPIVVLSQEPTDDGMERALDAGCNDVLSMDVSSRQLAAKVKTLARGRALHASEVEAHKAAAAAAAACVASNARAPSVTSAAPSAVESDPGPNRVKEAVPRRSSSRVSEAESSAKCSSVDSAASTTVGSDLPVHSKLKGGRELLSIDDTAVNHMVLDRIFTKEGFQFTSCLSGKTALALIEQRGYLPDVILLDVMMPDLDGFQVCTRLRELYGRELPILLISAKSEESNIVEGFRAGADDYIAKPFKRNELVSRVAARLVH